MEENEEFGSFRPQPPGCAQNRDFFLSSVHHEPFFEKLKVELFLVTPYSIGYAIREQTLFLK